MIRGTLTLWIVAVSVVVPACAALTGPEDEELSIAVWNGALLLTNHTGPTVYTHIVEANFAARSLWAPCVDPDRCPGIPPGRTDAVAFTDIAGWTEGDDRVLVSWWHLIEDGEGGFSPDSIRGEAVSVD